MDRTHRKEKQNNGDGYRLSLFRINLEHSSKREIPTMDSFAFHFQKVFILSKLKQNLLSKSCYHYYHIWQYYNYASPLV